MNHSTAVFLINDQVRAISCMYEDPEICKNALRYVFKSLDPNIKVGDFVIVPTDTRWKMTVVRVMEVDVEPDLESNIQFQWIIGIVSCADYDLIKMKEESAIEMIKRAEKRQKREELRKALALDAEAIAALPISHVAQIEEGE